MRFPRVKRAHDPIRFPGGRIRIGSVQYTVGAEIEDDEAGTVWRLLELLDGTRTPEEIVETMISSDASKEDVRELLNDLLETGHIEDAGAEPATGLTPAELLRYSRNENYFKWIDTAPDRTPYELQSRLKQSSVAVVGLGGSGSSVAMSLVAAGVGALHCVDFDDVEPSNLTRQLLYTEDDIGYPKVDRAVARLRNLNAQTHVIGAECKITSTDDVTALLATVDFAVLCADVPHPDIQLWTSDAAIRTGTPWSVCFYAGPMLTTGIFVPHKTPCYWCLLRTGPSPLKADDGATGQALYGGTDVNAALAPTAALTGHLGALEAIYYLTGLQAQTVGRIYHQNLMVYDHCYYVDVEFDAGCRHCGGGPG